MLTAAFRRISLPFLVCGALLPLSAGADTETAVSADPATLKFEGATGTSFKKLVILEAEIDITGLTLKSGYLRHSKDEDLWIDPPSVSITPDTPSDLDADSQEVFEIAITAISEPGTYQGEIQVTFTADGEDLSFDLPVSVTISKPVASIVSATPNVLRFEETAGSSFQQLVAIEATEDVSQLTLKSGYLRESENKELWIDPQHVVIAPNDPLVLSAGARKDVEVAITGAPDPGSYQGDIEIAFTTGGRALSFELPISVSINEPAFGVVFVEPQGKELAIGGIVGSSTFRRVIKLKATQEISDLTLAPGGLEDRRTHSWIAEGNVAVTPSSTSFEKGEEKELYVTVSNVTAPGLFAGSIAVSHAGTTERQYLELSVDAVEIDPIPAAIEVRFENEGWLFKGGTREVTLPLVLNADLERAPSILESALKSVRVSLDPLQHSTKKWEVMRLSPEAKSGSDPWNLVELSFRNSHRAPGTYTGSLRLSADDLGQVATIPVEVKVRASEWQAWLWMVVGILSSSAITYWKTTGKKKNALRGQLARLQARLRKSPVTAKDTEAVMKEIEFADALVDDDKLEDADTQVATIEGTLTAAIDAKRQLDDKAVEVEGLIARLQGIQLSLQEICGLEADRVVEYVKGIVGRVERLKKGIHSEVFARADNEELESGVASAEKEIQDLETAAREHRRLEDRVGRIAELLGQAFLDFPDFPGQKAIADELTQSHVKDPTEKLGSISYPDEVSKLTEQIRQVRNALDQADDVIRELRDLRKRIRDESPSGLSREEAENRILDLIRGLWQGRIPSMDEVDKLSRECWKESPEEEDRGRTRPGAALPGAPVARTSGSDQPSAPSGEQPSKAETEAAGDQQEQSVVRQVVRRWRQVRLWLTPTPDATESIVKVALYLIALGILVPIGMSQTYFKTATFGSSSVYMEYLFVFLWGFGIQTSTATAADVLTKIRGN